MSQVTMRDVARAAGVSVNTVSRALAGKPDVSPSTRAKVLAVAKQLGYRPNKLARGLRSNRTATIGVIVTDIANPYFGALVKGVKEAAHRHGYSIVLQDTDEDYAKEEEAIQVMLAEQVDGLLITPVQTGIDTILCLKEAEVPFVLLGRRFEELKTHYVVTDDVRGGYLATEHLIELGHTEIALINGPPHISSAKERRRGYQNALTEHGIEPDDGLIRSGAITAADGYREATALLRSTRRFTAIFCYSDFVAFGAIAAVREAGLHIPEDVAVVGYDDVELASYLDVPLTSVRIPKKELGAAAVEMLLEMLAGGQQEAGPQGIELPVQLFVRESTGG